METFPDASVEKCWACFVVQGPGCVPAALELQRAVAGSTAKITGKVAQNDLFIMVSSLLGNVLGHVHQIPFSLQEKSFCSASGPLLNHSSITGKPKRSPRLRSLGGSQSQDNGAYRGAVRWWCRSGCPHMAASAASESLYSLFGRITRHSETAGPGQEPTTVENSPSSDLPRGPPTAFWEITPMISATLQRTT